MTPHDYCRDKAAADGSSLHYSLLYLDAPRRQAIAAIHAFRQEINDIVERGTDIEPARAKLAWWRMEIGALFEQRADHPITRALTETLQHFPLAQEQLLEVIDGFEADLDRGRYEDYKSLQLYCYRVASTISAMTCEVLGYQHRQTARFAHELGLAMQLASLIRHVGWHARQGRIYLPLVELQQFGVSEEDVFTACSSHTISDGLLKALAFQTERARTLFDHAFSLLGAEDRKAQRALLVLAALERTALDEVENDGFRVFDRALSLTPLRKLWIATRIWVFR